MTSPSNERETANFSEDEAIIQLPGTFGENTPWRFYNSLIGDIPEDILVTDYCLGTKWSYVEAECGMGVSFTSEGGLPRTHKMDLRGLPLRQVAELSKSWNFSEATLGVAALNAWHARHELLDRLGATYDDAEDKPKINGRTNMKMDAFGLYRPSIEAVDNARVVVVGHFPHVEEMAGYCNLTVLERSCRDEWDTPDPACEYVLPEADFAFYTGVTIINKTAPRLLDLARNARTVMVGPSVVMSPRLLDWGVEMMAGSVVADPDKTRFAVKSGAGKLFGAALQTCSLKAPAGK